MLCSECRKSRSRVCIAKLGRAEQFLFKKCGNCDGFSGELQFSLGDIDFSIVAKWPYEALCNFVIENLKRLEDRTGIFTIIYHCSCYCCNSITVFFDIEDINAVELEDRMLKLLKWYVQYKTNPEVIFEAFCIHSVSKKAVNLFFFFDFLIRQSFTQ